MTRSLSIVLTCSSVAWSFLILVCILYLAQNMRIKIWLNLYTIAVRASSASPATCSWRVRDIAREVLRNLYTQVISSVLSVVDIQSVTLRTMWSDCTPSTSASREAGQIFYSILLVNFTRV